jgi:hypothetical protein
MPDGIRATEPTTDGALRFIRVALSGWYRAHETGCNTCGSLPLRGQRWSLTSFPFKSSAREQRKTPEQLLSIVEGSETRTNDARKSTHRSPVTSTVQASRNLHSL